jgi:recombination protein RecR
MESSFLPPPLEILVQRLAKLPGIGRKTAQRLALSILRNKEQDAKMLAEAILQVKSQIRWCSVCYCFTDVDPCAICANPMRNQKVICVVEQPNNIFPLEKTRAFKGLYHVLQGAIAPLDGVGPDQLRVKELQRRIEKSAIEELILATNPTVHGEATALYLQQEFQGKVPKITRLARGLPSGGDLEYIDEYTLSEALNGRKLL